jgi:hypothetical protein
MELRKVPNFLDQQLAEKILIAGKTIRYLKKFCNQRELDFSSIA